MWLNAWNRSQKECDEVKKRAAKVKGAKGPLDAEVATKMQQIEELGAQAFMAMVKTGHWAMAQSTAFKLYRAFAPPKGQDEAQGGPTAAMYNLILTASSSSSSSISLLVCHGLAHAV